ncbi:YlxR family protein [Jatrophihabitans sp.]|uniref:YlxR family protein n=1 Tax=Jatrophihabitans sp. TaxID=1932789 RepID=UPI0032C21836
MAVGASTASETSRSGPQSPIRTCVGCRQRASAVDLLRVVVAPDAIGKAAHQAPARSTSGARSSSEPLGGGPVALPVVPDPRRRIPGRGAWVHADPGCVELAQRRRAFGRALRVPGPVDPSGVLEYVAARGTG